MVQVRIGSKVRYMLTNRDFLSHTSRKKFGLDCFNQGAHQPLSNSLGLSEQRIVVSLFSWVADAHKQPKVFLCLIIPHFYSHISTLIPG